MAKQVATNKLMTKDEFNALPENEQRIAIAKDVLSQLQLNKLKAESGDWGLSTISEDLYSKYQENWRDIDAQKLILHEDTTCTACAIGSCFLSFVRMADDVKCSVGGRILHVASQWERTDSFIKIFGDDLVLMEFTFEAGSGRYKVESIENMELVINLNGDHTLSQYCLAFHFSHSGPKKLLTGMMKNIIANDGNFMPWKSIKVNNYLSSHSPI